jgi:hypothetical protein
MQKFVYTLVFATIFAAVPAWGQQRNNTTKAPPLLTPATVSPTAVAQTTPTAAVERKTQPVPSMFSPGEVKATPEMWFYEQNLKEYKDPKNAVRAKAEFTAQQRANRIATMRWFGLSNSRPRVSSDPLHVYPPAWGSNTPLQPNRWQATGGQPYYVARPESRETATY